MAKLYRSGLVAGTMLLAMLTLSCATRPVTPAAGEQLRDESQVALKAMIERDPPIQSLLEHAAGYAVFPLVGKGGFVVGGAFGRGTVYEKGSFAGYARVRQASVGGVIGARTSSLLLVFETAEDLQQFKTGQRIVFGAEATAIALTEGSSATTRFDNGVAVFALPRGGLMADASLSGQEFRFEQSKDPIPDSSSVSVE